MPISSKFFFHESDLQTISTTTEHRLYCWGIAVILARVADSQEKNSLCQSQANSSCMSLIKKRFQQLQSINCIVGGHCCYFGESRRLTRLRLAVPISSKFFIHESDLTTISTTAEYRLYCGGTAVILARVTDSQD